MSLATSGGLSGAGGAGAGGIAMAHQANAVGRANIPQPPPQAAHAGTGAPPSAAVLGADLLDKSQGLSLKGVKNVSHLPIVAVDLYGSDSHVAYFPKKPEDPSKGALPMAVSKLKTSVSFQKGEASHKTLRKYLSKSRTYLSLKKDSFGKDQKNSLTVDNPHLWMGLRRIEDAPDFQKEGLTLEELMTPAIAEEASASVGLVVANSTVDGSAGNHDDYDRVVFKVRLHESKKAVSMLPEEAVEMVLTEAQYQTAAKLKVGADDDEIVDYPFAVAVPAWASHDSAIESLMDAVGGNGAVFQRNVAALAGALLLSVDGKLTPILERVNTVRQALSKQHQKLLTKDPGAIFEDVVTLLVFGMTADGFEATAIQVTGANMNNVSCLFSEFKVLANISVRDKDPISRMDSCTNDLEAAIDVSAPDADGPSGIILCGSPAEQKAMASEWNKAKNDEWKKVPIFQTSPDCIARGTAVLGGVTHGRLSKLRADPGKKTRAELALKVQNVAPVAVAVRMNYFGGSETKWSEEKILFDFDRQIPAGPHTFELSAAECVVHRGGNADGLSEEDFEKAVKSNEGAKGIPLREEAALNLQVQVLQKWTRDGEWKKVGDVIEPLVKNDEKDDKTIRIACESVALDVSLGVTGLLTTSLVGERQSVALANKSARNSAIRYYVGIIFAILFFGGFLFKSYYDEYVLERDTKRLLAFYKHVVPGSFHDGDDHSARYTCYKYRGKKASLWRRLEKKYGEPVLETHEYEAMFALKEAEQDEETVDLDDGEAKETTQEEVPDL